MARYRFSPGKPRSAWNRNFYDQTVSNAYNLRHWSAPRYTSRCDYSYDREYKRRLPESARIFKEYNIRSVLTPQKNSLDEESKRNTEGKISQDETKRRSESNTEDSTAAHFSLLVKPSTVLRVLETLGPDKSRVNCTGFQGLDEKKGKKPEQFSTTDEKENNKSRTKSPVLIKYCLDHKLIGSKKRGTTSEQVHRKKSPQSKNMGNKNRDRASKSKKKLIVHEYSKKQRSAGKKKMTKKIKISIKSTAPEAQNSTSKRSDIRTKSCKTRYSSTNTRLQKHKLRDHSRRMSAKGRNANSLFPPISTQSVSYFLDQFDKTLKQGLKQMYK